MREPNNLDGLRLAGALMVIVGHAFHLTGRPAETPSVLGLEVQTLGVVIFFSVSGYLITASWARSRSVASYLASRSLRILPGLVLVVALTMMVVAPLVTTVPAGDLVTHPRWWSYLSNVVMVPRYDLPGVFTDVPHPAAVNGSLWTLPVEVFCYLAVPAFCVRDRRARLAVLALLVPTCLALSAAPGGASVVVLGTPVTAAAEVAVFFVAGAAIRTLHERWVGLLRADVAVVLLAAQAMLAVTAPAAVPWLAWLLLPYAVLTIGLARTPLVRSAARYGDLSYGLYLWGFPVQQAVVTSAGGLPMSTNLLTVTAVSALLAWLSWHLVERPALGVKTRLVARGVRASQAVGQTTVSGSIVAPVGPIWMSVPISGQTPQS